LRNEFDFLEQITIDGGHRKSKENIKVWSEKIRELGVTIFNYDYIECEFVKV